MSEKPMLFNTEMVRAILAGRKTQTRRFYAGNKIFQRPQPVMIGDLIYVRESWLRLPNGMYEYRADYPDQSMWNLARKWKPSIHMPKNAARIWLMVKGVKIQIVSDITEEEARAEGVKLESGENSYKEAFRRTWCAIYGENSWNMPVYVIEFERVDE